MLIKTIETESDMLRLGAKVAELLGLHGFVALYGDLGSGKSVFARGAAGAFGVTHVSSPTFTIVCEYPTTPKLYHFDAYRLSDSDELYAIGFSDYLLEDALVPEALPKDRVDISIVGSGMDVRTVTVEPHGIRYEEIFNETVSL